MWLTQGVGPAGGLPPAEALCLPESGHDTQVFHQGKGCFQTSSSLPVLTQPLLTFLRKKGNAPATGFSASLTAVGRR